MGWSHPDMSLEDLLTLIKGFVDILILASGYQSTGLFAHWDSHNIKNAFQWATFFENLVSRLRCLDDQQDSLKELDVALSEMKSSPLFPQGLEQLSSTTLGRARKFVLEHLIRALPLREAHLRAFITGTIELDLDDIHSTESDPLNIYLDELMLKSAMLDPASKGMSSMQESRTSYPEAIPNLASGCGSDGNLTMLTIHELMRRHSSVICMSSVETGLDVLSKTLAKSNWSEIADMLVTKNLEPPAALVAEVQVIDPDTWNMWRTKNMLYLLDKRTIRVVSGASMIFSAPRVQWLQVLERLDISGEGSDDIFIETVELLLLGCTADRWSTLVDHFMSISYEPLTITRMCNEVHNLLLRRYPNIDADKEVLNSKEKGILGHLDVLLSSQVRQLWKLSPILAAISIPPWSELFKLYVSELESQFKEESFAIRWCKDGKEHKDSGEVAERIWCLYIFHIQGSHRTNEATSS
ncbi:uncharacterized protein LOC108220527 isoform X1 [Daucus carota subsp. sativus]|uniref:uncharacterized protein LOC108220527 isoform X1 n=1 Tax=Daucus carota subsp. sativus TaxID=79200 RepID=UPI0007EF4054|nr:PREDICTED: uncharacterized protein LOC108220527 isoform X1 [Daucus carota subsp. sativus]